MRNFRYMIRFAGLPPYIGEEVFTDRHECCMAAHEAISKLKEELPAVTEILRGFRYHSWEEGTEEPAWNALIF